MSGANGRPPGRRSGAALITGGAGFVGTNLADRLMRDGRRVRVLDDLSRAGVEANLNWLGGEHPSALDVELGDVRDRDVVRRALSGVDTIYHLASQVAVTTSLDDPLNDLGVNVVGTVNLLEEARTMPRPPAIVFTSTNKVYGGLEDVQLRESERRYEPLDKRLREHGISERRRLCFSTPYGCSKGAADQYVLDYAHSYGLRSVVFRMSCVYGPHQCGNEDQGWVAHFLLRALAGLPLTIYGDGKQVRDILFVEDLVDALLTATDRVGELSGNAFNIGGGAANAVSLLDVVELIAMLTGREPAVLHDSWRQSDQRWYVSDTARFTQRTGWTPAVVPAVGLSRLHAWLLHERAIEERPELLGAI